MHCIEPLPCHGLDAPALVEPELSSSLLSDFLVCYLRAPTSYDKAHNRSILLRTHVVSFYGRIDVGGDLESAPPHVHEYHQGV